MVKQNATVRSSAAWYLESEVVVLDEQLPAPETRLLIEQTLLRGPVSIDAGGHHESQLTRIKTLKLRGDKEIYATFEVDQKRLWASREPRRLGDFLDSSTLYSCVSASHLIHN